MNFTASLTAAATGPMFDSPPSVALTYLWIPLTVGALIVVAGFVVSAVRKSNDEVSASIIIAGFIAVVLGFATLAVIDAAGGTGRSANHPACVQEWLADEYGVEVTTETVTRLLDGDTASVDYAGERTRIELDRNDSGRIDVYSTAGDLLEPVGK